LALLIALVPLALTLPVYDNSVQADDDVKAVTVDEEALSLEVSGDGQAPFQLGTIAEQALRKLHYAEDLMKANSNRAIAARREVEAVQAAYDAGKVTFDLLLDAQRRLVDAELAHMDAVADLAKEAAALEQAVRRSMNEQLTHDSSPESKISSGKVVDHQDIRRGELASNRTRTGENHSIEKCESLLAQRFLKEGSEAALKTWKRTHALLVIDPTDSNAEKDTRARENWNLFKEKIKRHVGESSNPH